MRELRVDIGGSNRGFVICTEETKRLAEDLNRSLTGSTPENFKGAQMMRDKYGKVFDELKGEEGIGGLLEKIAGGFGETGHAIMELATGPVGAATAAIGLMGEAAKSSWETMRESFMLARDARTLGVSTTALKEVDRAGEEQGMGDGEARGRLMRFQNKVGSAAAGDASAQKLFKEMGVEVDGKNMEEVLNGVAEAFEKINSPAEKARRAVELFGRGGQEMIPVLKEMSEKGGALKLMGLGDENTDAILGGAWKKIHGFFSQVWAGAKEGGKSILADVIQGYAGYDGEGTSPTGKIKTEESSEQKHQKMAAEATKKRELASAESAYRKELEATAATEEQRRSMLTDDRHEIELALKKAEAAHDEVEALKLKTELLRAEHAIADSTAKIKKEIADKNKPATVAAHTAQHVDSSSSMGLFQSVSAATNNPLLEVNQRMERHLAKISTNTGKHATDIHAP